MVRQLKGPPIAPNPLNCVSTAHCATAGNLPLRAQTVRLSDASFRPEPQRFGHSRSLAAPSIAIFALSIFTIAILLTFVYR